MKSLLHRAGIRALCALAVFGTLAQGADRKVQFRSIDLDNQIVELHNFGLTSVSIEGWKFCTHDFDEFLKYSGGLTGTLLPGESLFVHFKNNAPANPNSINISTIGGFFSTPIGTGPFGMAIFAPGPDSFVSFNSITDMNDHIQWALDPNASVGNMLTRSLQAVNAGLWTQSTATIDLEPTTSIIMLTDTTGGQLHSPANYELDPSDCPPDLNGDGIVDNGDIGAFVGLFLAGDLAADFNGDNILDNGDIGEFINAFLAGC